MMILYDDDNNDISDYDYVVHNDDDEDEDDEDYVWKNDDYNNDYDHDMVIWWLWWWFCYRSNMYCSRLYLLSWESIW